MRKYLRAKARAAMTRAGIQHMNRRETFVNPVTHVPEKADSYFSRHWRDYI